MQVKVLFWVPVREPVVLELLPPAFVKALWHALADWHTLHPNPPQPFSQEQSEAVKFANEDPPLADVCCATDL